MWQNTYIRHILYNMHFTWFSRKYRVFSHELTVSCPEPQSGEDRIWVGENPAFLENHMKCIFSHATLYFAQTNQFADNNKPTATAILNMVSTIHT